MAECGVKQLFKGILHLVTKYDNKARIVRLRNNFVPIDPAEWHSEFDVIVQVGLGTADDEQKIAFLQAIAAKQEQILQTLGANNPVVSLPQYVQTLRSIAEIGGFKDADQFFNSPQQIQQQMQMMQQQPQQDPNAAEMQAEMAKLQQEMALKRERMQMEMQLEREKMQAELELRRQELSAEAQLRAIKAQTDAEISTNLPR
jgi:flagellar biosynthesis GTPase FlhF